MLKYQIVGLLIMSLCMSFGLDLHGAQGCSDFDCIGYRSPADSLSEAIERILEEEVELSTYSQQKMLEEARQILQLKDNIKIFALKPQYESMGGFAKPLFKQEEKTIYAIALKSCPDLDDRLMTLYHELGHVIHKDCDVLEFNESVLKEQESKEDLSTINQLLELSKQAFDRSTRLGIVVNDILEKYPVPLLNEGEGLRLQMHYAKEQRADLYALEEMLRQKRLAPIIAGLYYWEPSSQGEIDIIESRDNKHPPSFQRLLYIAGFLVKHGFDLNLLLREWEQKGTCVSADSVYQLGKLQQTVKSLPSEEAFLMFRQEYN